MVEGIEHTIIIPQIPLIVVSVAHLSILFSCDGVGRNVESRNKVQQASFLYPNRVQDTPRTQCLRERSKTPAQRHPPDADVNLRGGIARVSRHVDRGSEDCLGTSGSVYSGARGGESTPPPGEPTGPNFAMKNPQESEGDKEDHNIPQDRVVAKSVDVREPQD